MSDSHPPKHGSAAAHAEPHKPHEEEGGEGWLVSYADMMTLLVGFFVILLSFSSVDQKKLETLKKATSKEFGGSYQVPYGDVASRIRDSIKKLGIGDQFTIKTTDEGVEISFTGAVFFDTGSAEIKPQGKMLLDKIIPTVKAESTDFNITVEGHTDDIPIGAHFQLKSNWELSSVRACRVLDVFENGGFLKSRLTAVGYGDARPVVPNRDKAGNPIPKNQSQNRRVIIKLLKRPEPSLGEESEDSEDSEEQEGSEASEPESHPEKSGE